MTKAKPIISAEELKQLIVQNGDFLKPESCLRLMRALAVEIHEDWIE